jgi:hypothetical protein
MPDHGAPKLTDPSQAIGQPAVTGEVNRKTPLPSVFQKIYAEPGNRLPVVYL